MKAVLFDMDGVILDSKEVWFRAFNEIGGVERKDFDENYWGRDLRENLRKIGEDHQEFCERKLDPFLEDLRPIPGAGDTLQDVDLPKGLITNTTLGCTERMLDAISMREHFSVIISSDMVENPKPDPEPVIKACSEMGIAPSDAYMVGDSEEDMRSGSAAGCTTVGLGVDGDMRIKDIEELLDILD